MRSLALLALNVDDLSLVILDMMMLGMLVLDMLILEVMTLGWADLDFGLSVLAEVAVEIHPIQARAMLFSSLCVEEVVQWPRLF